MLVTGGAGFLGSWLSDVLVSVGAVVHCVDNLCTGRSENVRHLLGSGKFEFTNRDVADFMPSEGVYNQIFHFASRASPEEYQQHPIETLAANSDGTRKMLELARRSGATLVYASTSEIYGDAQIVPTPESYWGYVNPIGIRSCYDEGKRFGEALCMAYHRAYGVDVRIVRIFNTYGPRLRSDGGYARAVSRFIEQAISGHAITVYGKGEQTRSFCYVTDTISGVLQVAARNDMAAEVFNLGNPHEMTILDLAEVVRTVVGSTSQITFYPRPQDDPQRRCPDISRARNMIGWSPMVSLEDGLRRTKDWFVRNLRLGQVN